MNNGLFNNLRALRGASAIVASLALLSFASAANAADTKPTAAEINKARAECAAEKHKVLAMESANADDPQLPAARLTWSHACGQAQDLISAASGVSPPAPKADPNTQQ